jgi:pyruvate dehydrogenase E2 component (dihydrolipoamide acetyltransferase)
MKTLTLPEAVKGMTSATVRRWLKGPKEAVKAGEDLLELEIQDAFVRLQSDIEGTLDEILAEEGATVSTGAPLAKLGNGAGATGSQQQQEEGRVVPESSKAVVEKTSAPSGDVVPVVMPQVGNTMEEGTILGWKVKEGDVVEVGQILFEAETDKATVEIEATDAGRVARVVVQEGETVAIKTPVAYLADSDEAVEAHLSVQEAAPAPETPQPAVAAPAARAAEAAPATVQAVAPGGRVKASPAARRIAEARGLDLHSVGAGSGPGGRILSTDLEKARSAAPASPGQAVRKPVPKMRRAIGKALQRSKQTVPHFYMRLTIDADPLFAFYRKRKPETGCTLNDVIMLACGRAIQEFPAFRSRIDGDELLEYPGANIGVAVGVEDGLVVPAVLNVDRLNLAGLAVETKSVVESARKGKLQNIGHANFTISNLGMFGVEEFSAIINPPEAAILAVSAVREDVIVKDGAMRPGRVMTMSLSSDHRLIDGLLAAQFLARLRGLLEAPGQLA